MGQSSAPASQQRHSGTPDSQQRRSETPSSPPINYAAVLQMLNRQVQTSAPKVLNKHVRLVLLPLCCSLAPSRHQLESYFGDGWWRWSLAAYHSACMFLTLSRFAAKGCSA